MVSHCENVSTGHVSISPISEKTSQFRLEPQGSSERLIPLLVQSVVTVTSFMPL